MHSRAALALFGLAVLSASCSSGAATCVVGSTQACLCVGGAFGVQSCVVGGTFAACECTGSLDGGPTSIDGGPTNDASVPCPAPLIECDGRCVDSSTDESSCGGCGATFACAAGSFCVMGTCRDVGACPPPFIVCDDDCIDPRNNSSYCGASGDCSGARAGSACSGACLGGRCVHESCSAVLVEGHSTGDGIYLVDVDGPGPIAPADAYCDMTTAGGGWTLVYAMHNDVPDIVEPWWAMVDLGSGTALPTSRSPLPAGVHFAGPTRDVRGAYALHSGVTRWRATRIDAAGATLLDVRGSDINGVLAIVTLDRPGSPSGFLACSDPSTPGEVLAVGPTSAFRAGDPFRECFTHDPATLADVDEARSLDLATREPIVGDETAGAETTTLFWVRSGN